MTEALSTARSRKRITLGCAAAALILGGLTVVGWMSEHPVLASGRLQYIPMAPSTALCFAAIGWTLAARILMPGWRWLAIGPGIVVLLVAAAKLVELSSGWRSGLDALLVRNPETFGAVLTGRMSPITAVSFWFTAVGVIALAEPQLRRYAGILGGLAAAVGAVVIVGYWYGTPLLYGGFIIPVAITTAAAFLVCGVGIIAAAGPEVWPLSAFVGPSTRALLLRYFVPALVAATLVTGWVRTRLLADSTINPAALSALSALALLAVLLWVVSKVSGIVGGSIDRAERARDEAQNELATLNGLLEQKVLERTRQLRERNEQMGEELQMARELQLALLPRKFPNVPPNALPQDSALQFLSLYFPTTDISGDFFTIVPLDEHSVGVFICDVMGHGVRSALVTSMIHALVEEHAGKQEEPGQLLTSINKALVRIFKQAGTTMFATGFYLIADVRRAQWRFASAGHPSPLHLRTGDRSQPTRLEQDGACGPAMGLFPNASYRTAQRRMSEEDLVILFTDGLFEVESESGELFTEQQLQEAVQRHALLPPEGMLGKVVDDVRAFSHRKAFDDDVCVVGVHVLHVATHGRLDEAAGVPAELRDMAGRAA